MIDLNWLPMANAILVMATMTGSPHAGAYPINYSHLRRLGCLMPRFSNNYATEINGMQLQNSILGAKTFHKQNNWHKY